MSESSVTILKYRLDGFYKFHVMDKFDEADEAKRLDRMIMWSREMQHRYKEKYVELWIKEAPIFPVKG